MIWFIVGAIVVGVVAAFLFRPKIPSMDMAPASLDSFSITQASEGSVVPVVVGRVRLPGNIIWYGNLETKKVKADGQVVGYDYWLDVWEALCMGKVSIIDMYVNDINKEITSAIETFNDGTEDDYPTQPGANANRLKGVAHIFWDRMYLGENQTFVPTVHFIVEADMSGSPVDYAIMAKGVNPAAIIYGLLIEAGASAPDIKLADFNSAAAFWNTQGYCLNINFSQQSKLRDKIAQVLSYVDGCYGVNEENKHTIKAYDPNDASVATLDREDFIEFTFTRKAWHDTYNEFRGNYIDEDQDYTKRTLVARNSANIRMQGRKRLRSVDLTAYRDVDVASKRLWEIMKKESYPDAQIQFKTNLEFDALNIGSVIEVNNSDYGMSSAEFRIITKDVTEVDQNVLGWRAIQMIETLFDDNYNPGGNPGWITPDYSPDPLVHQEVFELPYNSITLHSRAFLLLAARVNSFETGFKGLISNTGVDYEDKGAFSGWSQYGILDETYLATTYSIDDVGILYTPYREDPIFSTISRTNLFSVPRFALLGTEIVRFQTVVPEGGNSYRLTGIIRGVWNTPIAQHNSATPIWLFTITQNILQGITSDDFYVKMLPSFEGDVVDAGLASSTHVTPTSKAATPWPPIRVVVVRSGSDLSAEWWPTTQDNEGAGRASADSQTDMEPKQYDGDFETYFSGESPTVIIDGMTRNYSNGTVHNFLVRARRAGYVSSWASVYVPTGDGTYYGPVV